ncbi:MAG: TatD family hydrolase [Bacillota bacterium]|jgi:TatD DNase family protein|nr:TatD family hydrolase [Candidatus Fermentithermobacillaceae bacterium]
MEALYPDLIDTHAHVSGPEFDGDRQAVIERARGAGTGFIEVGFDVESSIRSIALAASGALAAAIGIHPHNALDYRDNLREAWRDIAGLISRQCPVKAPEPPVVAIGEIGLDYFRDLSPRPLQAECFEMGLELAKDNNLPVIIHQRDAEDDTIDILRNHRIGRPVIFHCFGGDRLYARKCLDLGGYLGVGGTVTYPKNSELRDLLKYIPLDRMLLETDAPYLSPQSRRGRRNEPAYMRETLAVVAAALGKEEGAVGRIARDNALMAFGL